MTKITTSELIIEEKPFNFDQILAECSATFIPIMLQKNIPLYSHTHPGTVLCLIGDEYRLRQVLFNLLSNAMKFTERGQVTITVNTQASTEADKVHLNISVSDSGIGIDPEQLKYVFKQFTQADASTTRRFGGSGLGLAISKSIVEKMGGTITASSVIDKGSTFQISIPIKVDLEREKLRHQALAKLQGKKLLAVSDYPKVLDNFKQHFIEWGTTVDIVETAEQVNQILEGNHPYDAMIAMLVTEPILVLRKIEKRNIPLLLLHHGLLDDIHTEWQANIKTLPVPASLQAAAEKLLALFGYSYLPADTVKADTNSRAQQPLPILIAEDNPTNQMVVSKMLENLGYNPDLANNGLEAVTMAAQKDYAIIFMDCEMPLMDGFMASKKILASDIRVRPVIVALTAHVLKDTEQQCVDAGMSQVLTKPISMTRLEELLNELKLDREYQ
jgi:CheY-like chemotaxis protein